MRAWGSRPISTSGPTALRTASRRAAAPRTTARQGSDAECGGGGAGAGRVAADAVAALTAGHAVDGKAGGLAGDVPQRVLDARDGGVDDRAAGEARVGVEVLPDAGDVSGVFALQPGGEVGDDG